MNIEPLTWFTVIVFGGSMVAVGVALLGAWLRQRWRARKAGAR